MRWFQWRTIAERLKPSTNSIKLIWIDAMGTHRYTYDRRSLLVFLWCSLCYYCSSTTAIIIQHHVSSYFLVHPLLTYFPLLFFLATLSSSSFVDAAVQLQHFIASPFQKLSYRPLISHNPLQTLEASLPRHVPRTTWRAHTRIFVYTCLHIFIYLFIYSFFYLFVYIYIEICMYIVTDRYMYLSIQAYNRYV